MRAASLILVAALVAPPAHARKNLSPPPQAAVAIESKRFGEIALYPEREASAQAVALNESRISAELAARLEAIPVEVGQVVPRGAVLARLDCRDQELARERADARAPRAAPPTGARLTMAPDSTIYAAWTKRFGKIAPSPGTPA